jgi:hypothetical protein
MTETNHQKHEDEINLQEQIDRFHRLGCNPLAGLLHRDVCTSAIVAWELFKLEEGNAHNQSHGGAKS